MRSIVLSLERTGAARHILPGHPAAHVQRQNARIGAERGWPPLSRGDFEREAWSGSLYAGFPETVARRIAGTIRTLGLSRFDLKYSVN